MEPKPGYGETPYPIASAAELVLPIVEFTLASQYLCHSCMGHRFDVEIAHKARNEGRSELVPCTVCGNAGAILPGGVMYVDTAGSHHFQYDRKDLDLGYVNVLARLRSPWPGRGGWYTKPEDDSEKGMHRLIEQTPAWGAHSLERGLFKAAANVARDDGLIVRSMRLLTPASWPAEWPRSRRVMEARDEMLAALDWPNGEWRRW